MRVEVAFADERIGLELPDEAVVLAWEGPPGMGPDRVRERVAEALESPRDYPPLRRAVVPGDHVVIALASDVPLPGPVLDAVVATLESAGVERASITVLAAVEEGSDLADALPAGVAFARHDRTDRDHLAYLATTSEGRRVYLNRLLTDADFVLPIGRLAYDPVLGYEGPWSVVYPGLSDMESWQATNGRVTDAPPDRTKPRPTLTEAIEVSWLLGCQFQLGLVAGVGGPIEVVAGLGETVLRDGEQAVDDAWTVRAESRAELVVAGVGRPGENTGLEDVGRALATARRLVQRGGKIALLSRAAGSIGPALQRLVGADDPRRAVSALKGHEADADYPTAYQFAQALAWADVYLLSGLEDDVVEELAMVALNKPSEVKRLASTTGSCLLVSQADLARATVVGE